LSLAGLAKLSREAIADVRFGLASAAIVDSEYTAGYLTADSTEIDEIPWLARLA
jgi:hypothetical protein